MVARGRVGVMVMLEFSGLSSYLYYDSELAWQGFYGGRFIIRGAQ